jgi:hypothetical protein
MHADGPPFPRSHSARFRARQPDRKKMKRALILCMLASGCAAGPGPGPEFLRLKAQSKTICEIMNFPGAYIGQRVTVRASYFNTPHELLLFDDHCKKWTFRLGLREWVKGDQPKQNMKVIYSGLFTTETIMMHCPDRECFRYLLEDSLLLATSPPPRR